MEIMEVKEFGICGYLTPEMWKRRLSSNQDLFRRAYVFPDHIPGPYLVAGGRVSGDEGFVENYFLRRHGSPGQADFYDFLLFEKKYGTQAMEYLLTMTNALQIWKKSYARIGAVHDQMQKSSERLSSLEEAVNQQQMKVMAALHIPEEVREAFPNFALPMEPLVVQAAEAYTIFFSTCNHIKKELREQARLMGSYLSKASKEYPFLFEKD